MKAVPKYLLGQSASFELPARNEIWQRQGTKKVLEKGGLRHEARVHLCRTGLKGRSGLPVGKQLKFMCTHHCMAQGLAKRFGVCMCTTP